MFDLLYLLYLQKISSIPNDYSTTKGHITGLKDVCKCIFTRLDAWERDKFDSLANDTITVAQEKMGQMQEGNDDDYCAKVVTWLIFEGKFRSAVRYATEREGRGILDIHTTDKNQ